MSKNDCTNKILFRETSLNKILFVHYQYQPVLVVLKDWTIPWIKAFDKRILYLVLHTYQNESSWSSSSSQRHVVMILFTYRQFVLV